MSQTSAVSGSWYGQVSSVRWLVGLGLTGAGASPGWRGTLGLTARWSFASHLMAAEARAFGDGGTVVSEA